MITARLRVLGLATVATIATVHVAAESPYPARWLDAEDLLGSGFGQVRFEARDGNELTALVYRPRGFDAENGPIWFVMHGASRDAQRYVRVAAPAAERYGALAIAIHFTTDLYPQQSDYTLGVTTSGEADVKSFAEGRWRRPDAYLYAEIEHVFAAVRRALDGKQPGYYVFGHSAGAQFTHRLLTFLPDAHVLGAVAANAGWYTLPAARAPPLDALPYGLRGSPLERADLSGLFSAPFAILLGERDTTTAATDDLVRGTPEALAQGATRLERGKLYHATAREQARAAGAPFAWRLAVAPRARHDAAHVIESAAFLLFAAREAPCIASSGAEGRALAFTEVLADPPDGAGGDANGDGTRDPSDDELVELVNRGTTPICLTGWSLGDAEDPERHTFPIGRALAPGKAVVVFGGGVPAGEFGSADVQTAALSGSLNLSNAGDVLALRDAKDRLVTQLSWGDCASQTCAADHWSGALGFAASIARSPEPSAGWRPHVALGELRFSPGVKPDGSAW